jgi:hypothetical protein
MTAKALPLLSVLVTAHDEVVCNEHQQAQPSSDVHCSIPAFEGTTGDLLRHKLTGIVTDRVCGGRS